MFLERRDRNEAEGRQFVFPVDETSFGPNSWSVFGYSRSKEPVECTIEFEENDDIIPWSSWSGILGCLSFARREGACRTANRFVASSTTFPLASGDILPLDNVVFHHCRCIRAIGDSIGIELLFIPRYAPWFNGIEGVLCIAKSTDGSFG